MKRVKQIKMVALGLLTMVAFQNCKLVDQYVAFDVPEADNIKVLHYRKALEQSYHLDRVTAPSLAEDLRLQAPQGNGLASAVYALGSCRVSGSVPAEDYRDLAKLVAESKVQEPLQPTGLVFILPAQESRTLEVIDHLNVSREYRLGLSSKHFSLLSAEAIQVQIQKIISGLSRYVANCPQPNSNQLLTVEYQFQSGFGLERKVQKLSMKLGGATAYARESSVTGRCAVSAAHNSAQYQALSKLLLTTPTRVSQITTIDSPEYSIVTRDYNGKAAEYGLYGAKPGKLVFQPSDAIHKNIESIIAGLEKSCPQVNVQRFAKLHYSYLGGFGRAPREVRQLTILDNMNTSEKVSASFYNGNCAVNTFVDRQDLRDLSNLIRSSSVTQSPLTVADAPEITLTAVEPNGQIKDYTLGIPFKSGQLGLSRSVEIKAKFEEVIKKINQSVGCKFLH